MGITTLLLAYVAGLGIAPFFDLPSYLIFLPLLPALLWFPLRSRSVGPALLAITFLTFGVSAYALRLTPASGPDHIGNFVSDRPLVVEGRVRTLSERPEREWVIDLDAEKAGSGGIFAPVKGGLRLYVEKGEPPALPGERVRFRARLRHPRTFGTPGEFDTPRYLAARGIFATAFLPDARDIAVLAQSERGLGSRLQQWRRAIAGRIDKAVPPEMAPMVKALSVGEAGSFSPEMRDLLARGGVSHLFAISGQHLALIAIFLFGVARLLYIRSETLLLLSPPRRILPPLLLPLLFVYLLLTGAALPTRRAFLMAAAGVLLVLGGRRTPPLKLLGSVAFVMLIAEPLAFFEPSFQLSFAGVLGILLVVPRWHARLMKLPRLPRWSAELLMSTVAATAATTPLVLFHFHLLAPASLLTNLWAVPAVGLGATLLGFFGTILIPLYPAGADLFFRGCASILEWTLAGVEWTVGFPLLSGWRLYAFPTEIAASALIAAALLLPVTGRRIAWAKGALLLAGAVLLVLPAPRAQGLSVMALSVGQGDAILLSRDGRHYLVDGGGMAGSTFDPGERLIAPALGRLGVRTLEAVILTHDHPDHLQGLIHILRHFPVRAFWSGIPPSELPYEVLEILRSRAIPFVWFAPGWRTVEQTAVGRLALFAPREGADPNDLSLVLYASQGRSGVLLTGDLETEGVERLLQEPPPGPVTLLKLPHHGSRRSSPELLLERFEPRMTFVSVGAGNTYGFPHAEVVAEHERRRIPLRRTDLEGTLRLRSEGSEWRCERWEKGLFR